MRRYALTILASMLIAAGCAKRSSPLASAAPRSEPPAAQASPAPATAVVPPQPASSAEAEWQKAVVQLKAAPISKVAIFYFLERTNAAMGERPKKMALYNLNQMQVVQKTAEGYLMRYNPPGDWPGGEYELAFLRTNIELAENQEFLDFAHWSVCEGTHQYLANNGFQREILSFVMLPDRGNAVVNERIGRR